MANFQTHVTVAAAASIAVTAGLVQEGSVTMAEAPLLILLGSFAGILPDIDSDHSVPVRMLFHMLGMVAAVMVLYLFYDRMQLSALLGLMFAATLVSRFLLYPMFAALTEHRGLFHSLPAAVLFGLVTFSVGYHLLGWSLNFGWLAAAFVSGGYALHLLLDELYSVNVVGSSLKRSFGSALTLFSPSAWPGYLLLYAVIALSLYQLPLPESLHGVGQIVLAKAIGID